MRNLILLTLILLLPVSAAFGDATVGDLHFSSNFQSLLDSSAQTRKPILIDFYTDWCTWCKVLQDSTFPDGYVQKFLKNFELGKINAEVDTNVAKRYGVRSYPTVLLLKSNGDEIDRVVGYEPPDDFVSSLVMSLSGVGTLDDLLGRLQASPRDLELIQKVAEKYMYRSQYGMARDYFKELVTGDKNNAAGLAAVGAYRLAYMKYKDKEYLEAADMYRYVAENFPHSDQAVDSDLMNAYCLQKAEKFDAAKESYQKFLEKYPDTDEREWINKQLEKMK
jgi:thioredoxin-related protein